jgi:hypothetical protein
VGPGVIVLDRIEQRVVFVFAIALSLLYIPPRCANWVLGAQRVLENVRVGQEKLGKIFGKFHSAQRKALR